MDNEFLLKVERMKEDYYSSNKKNMFLKKTQKNDCATNITSQLDINVLIKNTVYSIPNTNKIFFSYPVFKLYANQEVYPFIIQKVIELIKQTVYVYGKYDFNLDLKTVTVSACERHLPIFHVLIDQCFKTGMVFSTLLEKLSIYNTPNAMDTIIMLVKPFMESNIYGKLVFYKKKESEELLNEFLSKN